MELQFTVNQINERMWALDQAGRVRSYLLAGEEKALLVDTCFGGAIASLCASLTDKPITLVNTHADPDHVGGNVAGDPSAYRDDAQCAVGANRLHHKTDFIAVCVKLYDRAGAGISGSVDKRVSHAVDRCFANLLCVRQYGGYDLILKTGDPIGV